MPAPAADLEHHFLSRARGVVHVGANTGQERDRYAGYGLDVLWIEPLQAVYTDLCANLQGYPRQRAIRALITAENGREVAFNVASNGGASSSIFAFAKHVDLWPGVEFTSTEHLRTSTLASVLDEHFVDRARYDALALDVQGAECEVLSGAAAILGGFRWVKAEAADFEAYAGGCRDSDVAALLARHGFRERSRHRFATHPDGGSYFDIYFERA